MKMPKFLYCHAALAWGVLLAAGCAQVELVAPYQEQSPTDIPVKYGPQVLINEVCSGEAAWIEFYNVSDSESDLSGWFLWNDAGVASRFYIPSGTTLAPGAILAIDIPAGFAIPREGVGSLMLTTALNEICDKITVPQLEPTVASYGRSNDGGVTLVKLWDQTKGTSNNVARPYCPPATTGTVVINEVLYNATSKWLELYNTSSTDYDIGGCVLSNSVPAIYTIPEKTMLVAGGYYKLDVGVGGMFDLDSDGDELELKSYQAERLDYYELPPIGLNISYGRKMDGSDVLVKFTASTPGVSNNGAPEYVVIPKVQINEVFFNRRTATDQQYVEIYNFSGSELDISGYRIWYSTAAGSRVVVPAGTMLPSGGVYAAEMSTEITADDKGLITAIVTDPYADVHDSKEVSAGLLYPDASYGRHTDGSDTWVWFIFKGTKGSANNGAPLMICINEISYATGSNPKWGEYYNPNPVTVDITNYYHFGNPANNWTFRAPILVSSSTDYSLGTSKTMAPYSFVTTDQTTDGSLNYGANPTKVNLYYCTGTIPSTEAECTAYLIDTQTAVTQTQVTSSGRYPDGGQWKTTALAGKTKGTANIE